MLRREIDSRAEKRFRQASLVRFPARTRVAQSTVFSDPVAEDASLLRLLDQFVACRVAEMRNINGRCRITGKYDNFRAIVESPDGLACF